MKSGADAAPNDHLHTPPQAGRDEVSVGMRIEKHDRHGPHRDFQGGPAPGERGAGGDANARLPSRAERGGEASGEHGDDHAHHGSSEPLDHREVGIDEPLLQNDDA